MITRVNLREKYNLESFKHLLEKYRDYKSIYREIKINSILGKKCQFDITEINPPLLCELGISNENISTTNLKNVAFRINEISFIIDGDLEVIELILNIEILETPNGKLLESLINSGIALQINPKIMEWGAIPTKQLEQKFIIGFYANYEFNEAA
jgi:hypothetical protein